jgi:hypothetical protein
MMAGNCCCSSIIVATSAAWQADMGAVFVMTAALQPLPLWAGAIGVEQKPEVTKLLAAVVTITSQQKDAVIMPCSA